MERRLIDANAILKKIKAWENEYLNFNRDDLDDVTDEAIDKVELVASFIQNAPTIDAVEVVRCEDCENAQICSDCMGIDERSPVYKCPYIAEPNLGHEFCSWGKRRDNEHELH